MWHHIAQSQITFPMKSLFVTLLILGGAFLAYDYFLAEPGTKIVFKSLNPPPKPKSAPAAPAAPENKPAVAEAPPPTPMPAPARPAVTEEPPAPAPPPVQAAPATPRVDTIEMVTANWTKIPPTAFPREVKLQQDVEFKMSVGSSRVVAGSKAYALGASQGILTLAPTATSPARAQAPIDATDLKPQLTAIYEAWKIKRVEELKAITARKQQMAASAPATAAPSAGEVDPAGKPVRGSDGAYPLLLASMKSGQVTEITPSNIQGWQDPQTTTVEGKPGWAVKVNFEAKTVFGLYPTEAQALVVNGKVKGWYYTGSGEEVP